VIDGGRLEQLAPGSALVARARHEREVDSTMEAARRALGRGAPPLLVTAEAQSGGRGREGRSWHSPAGGNLYVTAALPFGGPVPSLPAFTLACGVALHEAASRLLGPDVELSIKWPNDLLSDGLKMAGVLCELVQAPRDNVVLCGLGVNVNARSFPPPLDAIATSMSLASGRTYEREQVLARICLELETAALLYGREGFAPFRDECLARSSLWGRRCRIDAIVGVMASIDDTGAIVIRMDDGTEAHVASGSPELLD
jgi:BirA family biotin operon repressor/biotin-[acetyl-CoA-carboxylase] ligase